MIRHLFALIIPTILGINFLFGQLAPPQNTSISAMSLDGDIRIILAEGEQALSQGDPAKAIKLAKEAMDALIGKEESSFNIIALHLLGKSHYQLDHLRRASRYMEEALPFAIQQKDTLQLLDLYKDLSDVYADRKQDKTSKEYTEQYYELSQRLIIRQKQAKMASLKQALQEEKTENDSISDEVLISRNAADSILELVDKKEAVLLQQSMDLEELKEQIIQSEKAQMEAEKEILKAEIQLEKKEKNTIYWAAGSIMFVIMVISFFLTRYQRQVRKKEVALERERSEQLEQVDKLRDQFLANTSHELRTPLNGIIGLTESLIDQLQQPETDSGADDPLTPEELQTSLEMVAGSGRRLASLVNDLLDFSRIRNAGVVLRQKPTDLYAMVDIVLRVSYPLTKGKQLQMHNEVSSSLPAVYADEDRLSQILHNLIGNAIKFTQSGQIWVRAEEKGKFLEISVQDTGIGIAQDKFDTIFGAFEQGDGSISREYSGAGLGLSITKFLIEQQGGKIWVNSETGEGSTFTFTLPLSDQVATEPKTRAPSRTSRLTPLVSEVKIHENEYENGYVKWASANSIHILIVDDEPINHQVLRQHLKKPSFEVHSAMNGPEALDMMKEGQVKFDLVLLDVMMPRMSGYEVAEQIRKRFLPSELPIIMVTAKNQVADLVKGLDTGANDYLAKPFTKDEFLARLNTHLNLQQINNATSRFVPMEFIKTLGRDAITEVQLGDHTAREITVFFSDIRDYTTLAEQMSPEENFKFVKAYAGRMGPIITQYRGFINQYLGDGIMALFQQGPTDAVRAAIEMQRSIASYNASRKAKNRPPLKIGMGLHTGPLIMGIIGDTNRSDPAVISDTVNIASRLEGLTKYYGINVAVSEDSYVGLKEPFKSTCRYLGLVKVKGKSTPLGIYDCFAGDPNPLLEQKLATRTVFEEALHQYLSGNMKEAVEGFQIVVNSCPEDLSALRLLNQSNQYLISGIPDEWIGVEIMDFK
ncbi:MAG: response regulator [Bacteroidota bacterium]